MHHVQHLPSTTLTIRNVEMKLKETLRVRAAKNGRSMEAELRAILRDALKDEIEPKERGLATAIHDRFARLGGVDLPRPAPITPRALMPIPAA